MRKIDWRDVLFAALVIAWMVGTFMLRHEK